MGDFGKLFSFLGGYDGFLLKGGKAAAEGNNSVAHNL
jgi:hypothetical protein